MTSKIILATGISVLLPILMGAQSWHKLSGLSPNVTLKQIEVSNSGTEYVLTNNDFVFYSEDNGNSWNPVSPPEFASFTANAREMHINNSSGRVFLGTSLNGIGYFDNEGASWGQEFFSTDPNTGLHESIGNIDSSGDLVVVSGNFNFGGSTQRYFYSTDNGDSWSDPVLALGLAEDILIDSSAHWLVATGIGLQKSTDLGESWEGVAFIGEKLRSINKTNEGVYYVVIQEPNNIDYQLHSSADLENWSLQATFSTTGPNGTSGFNEISFAEAGNSLLISSSDGLLIFDLSNNELTAVSNDVVLDAEQGSASEIKYVANNQVGVMSGEIPDFDWQQQYNGLMSTLTYQNDDFASHDGTIYSISAIGRLLSIMSDYASPQWSSSFVDDPESEFASNNKFLEVKNSEMVFVGSEFNLYRSEDMGQTWSSLTESTGLLPNGNGAFNFYYFNLDDADNLFGAQHNDDMNLWHSNDFGDSWTSLIDTQTILDLGFTLGFRYTGALQDETGKIYVSFQTLNLSHKLIVSEDDGTTWTDATPDFFDDLNGDIELIHHPITGLMLTTGSEIFQVIDDPGAVAVPWNSTAVEIQRISTVFNAEGIPFVNVEGTDFCTECGVYKLSDDNWTFHDAPDILPGETPIKGIALIGDSIPVVQTRYHFTMGHVDEMGYYYLSENAFTAISENDIENEVVVFPNPSSGEFQLLIPHKGTAVVYNPLGQQIYHSEFDTSLTINLGNASKGVYLLKVKTKKGIVTKRLVLN